MCIIWCLLAFKYYDTIKHNEKSEKSSDKKYFNEVKQPKDIIYPLDIQNDIPKFEKLNNIKINVFRYEREFDNPYDRDRFNPIYNTRGRNENVINYYY